MGESFPVYLFDASASVLGLKNLSDQRSRIEPYRNVQYTNHRPKRSIICSVAAAGLTECCRARITLKPSVAYTLATSNALAATTTNNSLHVFMGESLPVHPFDVATSVFGFKNLSNPLSVVRGTGLTSETAMDGNEARDERRCGSEGGWVNGSRRWKWLKWRAEGGRSVNLSRVKR
jgi:hypothetical protein